MRGDQQRTGNRRLAPSAADGPRELVGTDDIAVRLGVNTSFVRRLVYERRIPYFKIGKLVRFDLDEIDSWLERQRVDTLSAG